MLIGPVACTTEQKLIGSMIRQETLTYPCQSMFPAPHMNSNTQNAEGPNMHHTDGDVQITQQDKE